jgi:hypothetical protein
MVVKLGRTPEAITHALKSFKRPDEALVLAKALRESAAHDDALKIPDWRARLDELIERHRRKYKQRPLLEGLRGR